MLFNTPIFIFVFLPAALLVYSLLLKRGLDQLATLSLVLASLFFYGYYDYRYLALILLSIVGNLFIGRILVGAPDSQFRLRSLALAVGVSGNLLTLGYYKYANFFMQNIAELAGRSHSAMDITLPLAISFFTFQQIAYLVDCHRREVQRASALRYFLFVTFFPQLIAGPIVHHKEMMPQFTRQSWAGGTHVATGLLLFSMGLIKKSLIADTFAIWANAGYANPGALTVYESWLASLSYTFQLYFDFSGYSDMALGAALMFNIRLPQNFNSPYKALNIQDFWRRWHMTLSRWLRDYLYVPLGGNRHGRSRELAAILVTFLLGGLWHGAGWTFVVWGLLHGLALVVHRLWRASGLVLPPLVACALTFLFVHYTWVLFRAESLKDALSVLRAMHGIGAVPGPIAEMSWVNQNLVLVGEIANAPFDWTPVLFMAIFGGVAFWSRNSNEQIDALEGFNWRQSALIAFALFFAVVSTTQNSTSEFLYFNF